MDNGYWSADNFYSGRWCFELELNKRKKEVLCDILKTEIIEVEDMVKDDEDKEELESYLETVKSIFSKCKGDNVCMD